MILSLTDVMRISEGMLFNHFNVIGECYTPLYEIDPDINHYKTIVHTWQLIAFVNMKIVSKQLSRFKVLI